MEPVDFDYDIFVSYRRTGGQQHAQNIVSEMKAKGISSDRIFFDFNSLRDGVFNEQIIEAIHGSKNFILVLSKCSMDRCIEENDWVAREIRTALDSECKIIPVKINEEFEGYPDNFPQDMKERLTKYQITKLDTGEYHDVAIDRIYGRLDLTDRKRTMHLEPEDDVEPEEELSEEEKLINEYIEKAEVLENGDEENEPDIEEAVAWYQKAADLGDGYSWWKIGCYYQNYFDDKEHDVMAFDCFKKSADLDSGEGKVALAYCYLRGRGTKKYTPNALKLFNEVAEDGYIDGEYYIGKMYADGEGVKKDMVKAIQYYQESAGKGYADADVEIGCLYLFGRDVEPDWKIAKKHFDRAKENGSSMACFYLGLIYEKGLGVKFSYKKAYENFAVAKDDYIDGAEEHYNAVGACLEKNEYPYFQFTVEDPYTLSDGRFCVDGPINSGLVKIGDSVLIKGDDKELKSVVTGIESSFFPHQIKTIGFVGDYVKLYLRGVNEEDVKPGYTITLDEVTC